jgi:uncharacterized repeat protein (TIGR03803 family)
MKKIKIAFLIYLFCFIELNGQVPLLWGMTVGGGANNEGVIFKIKGDGTSAVSLYSFSALTGRWPRGSLLHFGNGILYGLTNSGGASNKGSLFKYDTLTNTYTDLLNFTASYGNYPDGNLIKTNSSKVYGLAFDWGTNFNGTVFYYSIPTASFNPFCSPNGTNGINPTGSLVMAKNGFLYGVTYQGGINNAGVIFKVDTASNAYTKIYDFGPNGKNPARSMIQSSNGKLYGMTTGGGLSNSGVLYSYNPSSGNYVNLFDFSSINGLPGSNHLIEANDGNLYGLTFMGGVNNLGVLFKFDTLTNTYSKLFDFSNSSGQVPMGGLMQASNGLLYGMTSVGGGPDSVGTVFSYNIASNTYTDIFNFSDIFGGDPFGDLIEITNNDVGIKEHEPVKFKLYPNPASNSIAIVSQQNNFQNAEIEITNYLGQTVLRMQYINAIDVSKLVPGIYTLRIITKENQSYYSKFVKE